MNSSRAKVLIGLLSTALLVVALMLPSRAAEGDSPQPDKEAKDVKSKDKETEKPDFPPLEKVLEGYEKVISTTDGKSLYTVWTRDKDQQMLAALPPDYEGKKYFIALTVSSGEDYAGLQAGSMYVYWRRYNDRLALVEPNLDIKSTGDDESKNSVQRLFTDRIILDVPIVTISSKDSSIIEKNCPVIDMDAMLIGQCDKFFGNDVKISNPKLVKIQEAKAFPENIELAFEVPTAGGRLQTLHYSISVIPQNTGYKPRKADSRVGYFTTTFSDYGQFKEPETKVRYINRWNLEKADPSLQVSPPKTPIVFYIENTTPVRYRRWVRQGILYWNQAFEKVGISNAIEVYYQDKKSGAHMEKDPEDVRYNFIRWLSNNQGTAIGPSRVNPETGQILDADVVLTDGWIRHYWITYHKVMPELAMEGFSPETLVWLADHPRWDPRVRLAPPGQREYLQQQIAQQRGMPYGGHPITRVRPNLIGDDEYDGLAGTMCQRNGLCTLEWGRALDVAMFRMEWALAGDDPEEKDKAEGDKKDEEKKDKEPTIDGMPESFIGPLVADLTCHEVGHTLGLRHNFKASSLYTMAEINSKAVKSAKPHAGSVMDYLPVNMNFQDGEVQGDYCMISVGPYDVWAIEYGYTQDEKKLKDILGRVAEPELQYATDEDTFGPDPLARRYDFSKDPLDYARNQMRIANRNRARILSDLVKEGDAWAKARRYYELTLGLQMRSVSMMANWLGGDFIHRDKKGDKNGRVPIEPVPAKQQRDALAFVVENAFQDQAYGLTTDLLTHMAEEKWWDDWSSIFAESTWPVHDQIMGFQAYTLTAMMNPDTLRRIYDNEFLQAPQTDVVTLPELLETIRQAVWTELDQSSGAKHDARNPMISSLRRNLQHEHLERLIDLSKPDSISSAVYKPIGDLVIEQLRQIKGKIDPVLDAQKDAMDAYTKAHLRDASTQIQKALDAHYVYQSL